MRLIDADAFAESLIHCDALGRKSFEAVLNALNEQPTAYDVDKVLEQLEKEKDMHTLGYNLSLYKDKEIKDKYKTVMIVLDEVIEIVRKGGVRG